MCTTSLVADTPVPISNATLLHSYIHLNSYPLVAAINRGKKNGIEDTLTTIDTTFVLYYLDLPTPTPSSPPTSTGPSSTLSLSMYAIPPPHTHWLTSV